MPAQIDRKKLARRMAVKAALIKLKTSILLIKMCARVNAEIIRIVSEADAKGLLQLQSYLVSARRTHISAIRMFNDLKRM